MSELPRRRFGRTELAMPVFSCGSMRYQYKWQDQPLASIPRDSQQNLEATVRRALELGINHIETAHGYGSSERQLGQLLPTLQRDKIIVQTKVTPKAEPRAFEREFEESLERLQLDHVDLFSLHGINDETALDWSIRPGGCFEVAQRLRAQGKCRYVGFSTHAEPAIISKAIRFGEARVGEGFDYINLHWYFILQRNWPAIEEAARRDMGVFVISPSDKGGRLYSPPPELVELCRPLSPMQFNDLFCLSRPEVHTLSIGAARPSDFDEHVSVRSLLPDSASLLPPVVERLGGAMLAATGHRDPEAVTLGLPRWQDTPRRYNLPTILWLRNLCVGWGLVDYAKWRFNMLTGSDNWFPGNRPQSVEEIGRAGLARVLPAARAGEVVALLEDAFARLEAAPQKRLSQGGA